MDSICVIVDRLTKPAHFLLVKTPYNVDKLVTLYMNEIARLHGVPISIVSDRDPKFTSRFWQSLQKIMGTELRLSSAYHPQTDGQSERTIQTLEDMLHMCVLDFQGNLETHLPLVEFAYNDSYHSSLGIAPCEALYGRKCQSPICWAEDGDILLLGPELVQETTKKVKLIQQRLKTTQSRQKSYADVRRREGKYKGGNHVFIKFTPMKGHTRFGTNGKLAPRYIEPYEVIEKLSLVVYQVALPPDMEHMHNIFHISMLRESILDSQQVIKPTQILMSNDYTYTERPIQIISRRIMKLRNKDIS